MYFHSSRKGYEGNDYEQPESDKIAISSATFQGLVCLKGSVKETCSDQGQVRITKSLKFIFSVKTKCQVLWYVKGQKERRLRDLT